MRTVAVVDLRWGEVWAIYVHYCFLFFLANQICMATIIRRAMLSIQDRDRCSEMCHSLLCCAAGLETIDGIITAAAVVALSCCPNWICPVNNISNMTVLVSNRNKKKRSKDQKINTLRIYHMSFVSHQKSGDRVLVKVLKIWVVAAILHRLCMYIIDMTCPNRTVLSLSLSRSFCVRVVPWYLLGWPDQYPVLVNEQCAPYFRSMWAAGPSSDVDID